MAEESSALWAPLAPAHSTADRLYKELWGIPKHPQIHPWLLLFLQEMLFHSVGLPVPLHS